MGCSIFLLWCVYFFSHQHLKRTFLS
ncbi:hypothetical protein TSAR_013272 [Trichomalopsis sarcophagae]|uniref:Uncharacterized protein n=1 Tax=Trichomalopsis sarcophagae TaxID=543379 RepID=A0A232EF21_9HYME|nr:hypothetical protein TSAR_013272 [Trichomalopsis sarcophagae]